MNRPRRWWKPNVELGVFGDPKVWPAAISAGVGATVTMVVREMQRPDAPKSVRGQMSPVDALLAIPTALFVLAAAVWIVLVTTQWIRSRRLRFFAALAVGIVLAIMITVGALLVLA